MSTTGTERQAPDRQLRHDARMRRPVSLPPELHGRAFAVSEAIELGVTSTRLEAQDLTRPFKGGRVSLGVNHVEEENAIVRRVRALAPLLLPGQFFSHTTAAAVLELRMPSRFAEEVLHVTSTGGRRAPRRTGVTGHRSECPSIIARGFPVSGPVETWLHCAELLSTSDLVIIGDGLVARRRPLATTEDLVRAIDAHTRLPGVVSLRAALARVRPRTDSAMETVLRLALVDAGLPEPVVNLPIYDELGRAFAYADLAWEAERVIIEYDGDHHRTDRTQYSTDIDRVGRLQQLGWLVIRVDAALLRDRRTLLTRVGAALLSRRPRPR